MQSNLGQTAIRQRRRHEDPMAAYDRLPSELRHWLREAKLPWSPRSVRKIWVKGQREGLGTDDILSKLDRAENRMLTREIIAT